MAWITTKDGRRVDTEWFDEDERKKYEQIEQNAKQAAGLNSNKVFNLTQEIFRQDKEGWTFGKTSAGDIWLGDKSGNHIFETAKDTPENRARLNSVWEANSFAKEIKIKQPVNMADVHAKLAKLDMATFSGKMQAINTLMGAGIKELNKSDVKDIFGNHEQLKDELEYLGCRVQKVADLFNVKMPDTKFTREELQRQKQLERSTKGLF